MTTAWLFVTLIFSSLGMGYLIYGRKQHHPVALCAGICLCIYPCFISNVWLSAGIGIALAAAPFLIRLD
jgi:hypothetical protein